MRTSEVRVVLDRSHNVFDGTLMWSRHLFTLYAGDVNLVLEALDGMQWYFVLSARGMGWVFMPGEERHET